MEFAIFKYKLVGTSPLLICSPRRMTMTAEELTKLGVKLDANNKLMSKHLTPEQDAFLGLHIDDEGNYCLASAAIRAALIYACKGKDAGKRRTLNTVMNEHAFNVDELCPLFNPKTDEVYCKREHYKIDGRLVKAGVIKSRPRFFPWACYVYFRLNVSGNITNIVDRVLTNLNEGGDICGVGSFRLERKGPFGRFEAELVDDLPNK